MRSPERIWKAFIEHEQYRGLKASTVQMSMRTVKAFISFLIENGALHPHLLKRRMWIKVPSSLPRAMEPDVTRDCSLLLIIPAIGP